MELVYVVYIFVVQLKLKSIPQNDHFSTNSNLRILFYEEEKHTRDLEKDGMTPHIIYI